VRIEVYGLPTAQGSKRAFVNKHTGRAHVTETNDSKVKTWREDVKQAALQALDGGARFTGPVKVSVDFYFLRPKGHYRTGRNAHLLKDTAPPYPASKPDVDKLLRSTFDAITTTGLWEDDCRVVEVWATKRYVAEGRHQGAHIWIREAMNDDAEVSYSELPVDSVQSV